MTGMDLPLGPVGSAFLDDQRYLKLICGPVGGGKSTVAFFDLLKRAFEQEPFGRVRRTKFIIVRNTSAQLKSTVKPLIDQWMTTLWGGTMGSWRLTDSTYELKARLPDGTVVHSEFVLMPADTPDDVRRLLSLEASAAWVEEAREVDPEVFSALQGRVNRFPNRAAGGVSRPGVICSTNPPPLGGFWHEFMTKSNPEKVGIHMQPAALLDDGSLNPEAENLANLAPDYYANLIEGKSEDWINVYLKNRFGAGDMGSPVFRASFKPSFHVSSTPLVAVPQSVNPLIIGMDNGLQAAAVIGQQDMRGRVNVLGEAFVPEDETMGVETFMDRLLMPMLARRFNEFQHSRIVFVVDPACFTRSQVDEKTIAQAIAQRGFQVVKAPTNDPERRIQAVEGLLCRQIDGGPAMLIDKTCPHLINALEWGFRYKKTAQGSLNPTFDKTHHSHIADAAQYLSLSYGLVGPNSAAMGRVKARPVVRRSYVY